MDWATEDFEDLHSDYVDQMHSNLDKICDDMVLTPKILRKLESEKVIKSGFREELEGYVQNEKKHEAAAKLMGFIMNKVSFGQFRTFFNTLQENKQYQVCSLLLPYDRYTDIGTRKDNLVDLEEEFSNHMRQNLVQITKKLDVSQEFLLNLEMRNVIKHWTLQDLQSRTEYDAVARLLEIVMMQISLGQFKDFCRAVRDNNQKHLLHLFIPKEHYESKEFMQQLLGAVCSRVTDNTLESKTGPQNTTENKNDSQKTLTQITVVEKTKADHLLPQHPKELEHVYSISDTYFTKVTFNVDGNLIAYDENIKNLCKYKLDGGHLMCQKKPCGHQKLYKSMRLHKGWGCLVAADDGPVITILDDKNEPERAFTLHGTESCVEVVGMGDSTMGVQRSGVDGQSTISIHDSKGQLTHMGPTVSKLQQWDMDSQGRIIAATDQGVVIYKQDGTEILRLAPELPCYGLVVDKYDNIWVTAHLNRRVIVYDTSGKLILETHVRYQGGKVHVHSNGFLAISKPGNDIDVYRVW